MQSVNWRDESAMRKVVPFSTITHAPDGRVRSTIRIRPNSHATIGVTLDLKTGTALMLDRIVVANDDRWSILDIQIDGERQHLDLPSGFMAMRPARREVCLGVQYIGSEIEGEVFNAAITAALIACSAEDPIP